MFKWLVNWTIRTYSALWSPCFATEWYRMGRMEHYVAQEEGETGDGSPSVRESGLRHRAGGRGAQSERALCLASDQIWAFGGEENRQAVPHYPRGGAEVLGEFAVSGAATAEVVEAQKQNSASSKLVEGSRADAVRWSRSWRISPCLQCIISLQTKQSFLCGLCKTLGLASCVSGLGNGSVRSPSATWSILNQLKSASGHLCRRLIVNCMVHGGSRRAKASCGCGRWSFSGVGSFTITPCSPVCRICGALPGWTSGTSWPALHASRRSVTRRLCGAMSASMWSRGAS